MVVKSNASIATNAATKRLEKVIDSHRSYFSEWRSEKFDRSNSSDEIGVATKIDADKQVISR